MASTSVQVDVFSDGIIQDVKEGKESALKVMVQLKAMEMATERIKKEIKDNVLTEADKHPGTEFEFLGNKISKGDVYTAYDFSKCGDTEWEQLEADFKTAQNRLKERETFLKTIKTPLPTTDRFTGEDIIISPPTKRTVPGIKISIK
jgi:hypothetical protein